MSCHSSFEYAAELNYDNHPGQEPAAKTLYEGLFEEALSQGLKTKTLKAQLCNQARQALREMADAVGATQFAILHPHPDAWLEELKDSLRVAVNHTPMVNNLPRYGYELGYNITDDPTPYILWQVYNGFAEDEAARLQYFTSADTAARIFFGLICRSAFGVGLPNSQA